MVDRNRPWHRRLPVGGHAGPGGRRARRGPGRPRDEHADEAILRAARELLEGAGYGSLTLAGVAQRADVGKGTIYRRWRVKGQLVAHLLAEALAGAPAADTGGVAGDLLAFVRGLAAALDTPLARRAVPGLAGDLQGDADLAAAFRARLAGATRDRVAGALQRARQRGELRADADPAVVTELLLGPVLWRLLLSGRPLADDFLERVVDGVVRGLPARAVPRRRGLAR